MRSRMLGILLVALMAAMGLYAPAAQAQVSAYVPTGVCVVVGTVQLSDGGAVLSGEVFPGNYIHGPGGEDGGETFTFTTTLIICAGIPTGVCSVNATGGTAQDSPTSGFSGSFTANGPCTGSGHSCSGQIGGPGILHWNGSLTPTIDPGFPWMGDDIPVVGGPPLDGRWSFTFANVVLGSMDEVSCTGGIGSPTTDMVDGDGLLALTATPIPVPVSSGCEDADLLIPTVGTPPTTVPPITVPPPPSPTNPLLPWISGAVGVYCQLVISGVAVLFSEANDGA